MNLNKIENTNQVSFFNNIDSLFNFILELNEWIGDSFGESPISLTYVTMFKTMILPKFSEEEFQTQVLEKFLENFNKFSFFEKFNERDLNFYKEILFKELLISNDLPSFIKENIKNIISNILDKDYLEEDHLDFLQETVKNIISDGIKYGYEKKSFKVKDERWLTI